MSKPLGEVTLWLLDEKGEKLSEVSLSSSLFYKQQLPGGLLKPTAAVSNVPALLTDAGRFPLRGRTLVCTLHEADAADSPAKRRFHYELDGYGRITSFSEEILKS